MLHPTGRHGKLKLSFAIRQPGRTTMTENFFRVPLQVMKPYHDETGCLCVYLLSPTGGVVQGDDCQIDVCLSSGTHVLLTTQAATKVYGMPAHGTGACTHIRLNIGENAMLEYLPDPTILFRDSIFDQRIHVFLARGARAVLQEIIMPGRLARGEVFAFTQYRARLEASDEMGRLLYDALCLQPHRTPHLTSLGVLEGYPCWGNWYLLGDFELASVQWDNLCERADALLNLHGKSIGGISRLHRNGLAVRMVAHNTQAIQSAFQSLWNVLKAEVLGLKPIHLRKV